MTAGHQYDALDREMLVEIAIGQRAEVERLRAALGAVLKAYRDDEDANRMAEIAVAGLTAGAFSADTDTAIHR